MIPGTLANAVNFQDLDQQIDEGFIDDGDMMDESISSSALARNEVPIAEPVEESGDDDDEDEVKMKLHLLNPSSKLITYSAIHKQLLTFRWTTSMSLQPRHPTDYSNRLPKGWKDNILPADQRWIGKSSFCFKRYADKPVDELVVPTNSSDQYRKATYSGSVLQKVPVSLDAPIIVDNRFPLSSPRDVCIRRASTTESALYWISKIIII